MTPDAILRVEVRGFLFLLAGTLAVKMLTRAISLDGLLGRKDGTDRAVSPERVQLLMATIAMGMKYIGEVAHNTQTASLPDVSNQWLYVFGGSSGIYASVKALTMWRKG